MVEIWYGRPYPLGATYDGSGTGAVYALVVAGVFAAYFVWMRNSSLEKWALS